MGASDICLIVLAVFLPPVAVALERGCGADLLINILLTLLGHIPGIIHAIYVILRHRERRGDRLSLANRTQQPMYADQTRQQQQPPYVNQPMMGKSQQPPPPQQGYMDQNQNYYGGQAHAQTDGYNAHQTGPEPQYREAAPPTYVYPDVDGQMSGGKAMGPGGHTEKYGTREV